MKRNEKHKNKLEKQNNSFVQILKDWWRVKHPILLFMLIFGGLMTVFYILINQAFFVNNLHPKLLSVNASISSFVLNILGQNTSISTTAITSSAFAIDIKQGCDALEPIALLMSAILAYPGAIGKKVMGIFISIIILLVINIVRIVSLFLIGIYWSNLFDVMHVEVWQFLFILFVITLCFIWIKWVAETSIPKLELHA